ncbi:hypothetical protein Xen7305DRAFT_00033730 [Xenococcus sp. PCC 7305]|uniref:hypothetical protein n=1 Tax=Xenococcus sp. PCC 7305 TaxID=102125 RepID=UPI0002AC40A2|nr:hypothetical protein [Xenococcus sp. PCC 7305]ELS03649.1 hypothetical protein Xen7305DRAFT_00033730 [Xenococcus sp. PCC 7305]
MSALPQYYIQVGSDEHLSSEVSNTQITSNTQPKSSNNSPSAPSHFPQAKKFPAYLKVLLLLQKCSLGVAGLSIATGIGLYLSTVSIPQQWSKEYRNLETLQSQERQLTSIGERLKYEVSQQAQQFQMSPITPENTVFLTPNTVAVKPQLNQKNQGKSLKKISLGY